MTYQAPDPRMAIMDWKLASRLGPQQQAVCYRWECLSCEYFKRNLMGGLILDGERQKSWWCQLIDERKLPCKIRDELGAKISPPPKRTQTTLPKTEQQRSTSNQVGHENQKLRLPSPNIPSKPTLGKSISAKPQPVLPHVQAMETETERRSVHKPKRPSS